MRGVLLAALAAAAAAQELRFIEAFSGALLGSFPGNEITATCVLVVVVLVCVLCVFCVFCVFVRLWTFGWWRAHANARVAQHNAVVGGGGGARQPTEHGARHPVWRHNLVPQHFADVGVRQAAAAFSQQPRILRF